MATLIPSFNSCSQRMTSGERRFAQRLEEKLDKDYLLWYDVPVGRNRQHPDFVVLHPHRGIIILEVKDWKLETIRQINREEVTILTYTGEKVVKNPLEQARDYALMIANVLEQDKLLIQAEGRYRGNLMFPYSYGVVLANITRKQFDSQEGLRDVLTDNLVICRDEMYESVDAYEFQQRLWNLCSYEFGEPLTSAQIDRIRWHLFPEIRVGVQLSLLPNEPEPETAPVAIPDIIRVMDIQQEQLARSMRDGHRVVHGVAGSGKTLILIYRCLHLVAEVDKPILVLCFNVSLGAQLRELLHAKGIGADRVAVQHFHGWITEQLRSYRIPRPSTNEFQGEAYINELVERVIRAVDAGVIPAGKYGAVLIDEGHDFQPEWLKLAAQMVDPQTNSLLLLYDDAQSIYEKRQKRKFTFKSVGIQAQGRTTVFNINYRNTQEILTLASEFAKEMLTPAGEQAEDTPVLVQPQTAGRRGPKPQLIKLPNFKQETEYLLGQVQQFHDQGTPWNEMAIVYRTKWMAQQISDRFKQAGIPLEWINRDENSRFFNPTEQSIKLVTMHSSKGLEFPVVLIPGVGQMPLNNVSVEEEARLLYVGMTRAIDQLVITCDRSSAFVQRLEIALGKTA